MKNTNTSSMLPTEAELKQYQEGTLSASRAKEIEQMAKNNPLVADAIEGFAAIPAFAALPTADVFLHQATGHSASASANTIAATSKGAAATGSWISAKTAIIALSAGVMSTATWFYTQEKDMVTPAVAAQPTLETLTVTQSRPAPKTRQ